MSKGGGVYTMLFDFTAENVLSRGIFTTKDMEQKEYKIDVLYFTQYVIAN